MTKEKLNNENGRYIPSLSLRVGFANEAIPYRLPHPIGLAMTEQTGRSMVEMLGTLAIMGVIGITGIWGFNAAMNSHHSNEFLYEVNKPANTCVAQITLIGRDCNLSYHKT